MTEQQTATTQQIGRNIAEAASGATDIARMSVELQQLASQFRV